MLPVFLYKQESLEVHLLVEKAQAFTTRRRSWMKWPPFGTLLRVYRVYGIASQWVSNESPFSEYGVWKRGAYPYQKQRNACPHGRYSLQSSPPFLLYTTYITYYVQYFIQVQCTVQYLTCIETSQWNPPSRLMTPSCRLVERFNKLGRSSKGQEGLQVVTMSHLQVLQLLWRCPRRKVDPAGTGGSRA